MTSKIIEVDFLNREKESVESPPTDLSSIDECETKEQKLLRLAKAIEENIYKPNLEDVAEAILAEVLLDEDAEIDK